MRKGTSFKQTACAALALLALALPAQAGGRARLTGHRMAWDSRAVSFFKYVNNVRGCSLPTQDQKNVNDLLTALKRDGLFDAFDILEVPGLFADECAGYVNLVRPGFATASASGAVAYAPYYGVTGDQISAYLDIGVGTSGLSRFTQNSAHMSVWTLQLAPSSTNDNIGALGAAIHLLADICSSGNLRVFRLNTTVSVNDGACATGLSSVDRTDSGHHSTYVNGAVRTANATTVSTALDSNHITILAGSSPAVFSGSSVAAWAFGRALSAAEEATFYTDLLTSLQASGASPPNNDVCNGGGADPCLPSFFTGSGAGSMNAAVNAGALRITAHTSCPTSDAVTESTFKYFPFTVCSNLNVRTNEASTYTQGKLSHFIWANRYNNQDGLGRTAPPNPISPVVITTGGSECRMQFSTKAKADAATEARVAYSVGFGAHDVSGFGYLDITEAAGIADDHVLFYDATEGTPNLVASKDTLCTDTAGYPPYGLLPIDSVVLTYGQLARAAMAKDGIVLDWEVQDGHNCAETLATQRALAQIVHAKGFTLSIYTNPLDAGTRPYNGYCFQNEVGANMDSIMAAGGPDYFDLMLQSGNSAGSVTDELSFGISAFAAPPYSKLQVIALVSKITADDAAAIRTAVEANGMAGIDVFLDGAVAGGQCSRPTNQKVAVLTGLSAC